jgi:hypothetical protein
MFKAALHSLVSNPVKPHQGAAQQQGHGMLGQTTDDYSRLIKPLQECYVLHSVSSRFPYEGAANGSV